MASTSSPSSDLMRFLGIIQTNLREKECEIKNKKTRKGCIGECLDCWKQNYLNRIQKKYAKDVFFVTGNVPDNIDILSSDDEIAGLSPSERINRWTEYYKDIDFGDSWDDYDFAN